VIAHPTGSGSSRTQRPQPRGPGLTSARLVRIATPRSPHSLLPPGACLHGPLSSV